MKRGVLQITIDEASAAVETVPATQQSQPLYHKLVSARQQSGDVVQVQLSEEEAEVILDNVGVPMEGERESKQTLRNKVQAFLMKLRGNE